MSLPGGPLKLIGIQAFVRAGVFEYDADGADEGILVKFPNFRAVALFNPDLDLLSFLKGDAGEGMAVQVIAIPLLLGQRRFFVPYCCGAARTLLIAERAGFICPRCYRNSSGGPPVRHKRALLFEAESLLKQRAQAGPQVQRIDRAPKRAYRKRSVQASADKAAPPDQAVHDLQTGPALDRGRGLSDSDIFSRYLARPAENWPKTDQAPDYTRPLTTAFVDSRPMLDLRVLFKQQTWVKDRVIGQTLCWGGDYPRILEVALFVDWRGQIPQLIVAHDWHDPVQRVWQRLAIAQTATGKWRFVCPLTGVHYDVLYERDGIFASRVAHRLVHRSQRGPGRRKAKGAEEQKGA